MKKTLFSLMTLCLVFFLYAQDEGIKEEYNKFSIELEGGSHKPIKPFNDGYYTSTPSFGYGGIGARYMFNNYFGLKADFAYHNIQGADDSNEFETAYMRSSIQGVANLGNVFRFHDWTQTFGLLVHAGMGISFNKPSEPIEFSSSDHMLNFIAGIRPQIRLSDRVALTGDASLIMHARQNQAWDGSAPIGEIRGVDGTMLTGSIGLTFYLGKHDKHADWHTEESTVLNTLEEFDQRLSKIETDLIDSDQDGVPDYLDREPNTISGVTVDTKGRAIDKNANGIPDEIESALEKNYVNKNEMDKYLSKSQGGSIEELINGGYVNVYFRFNSSTPEAYSLQSLNYLVTYMRNNPSVKAELTGYTDEIGNAEYNLQLSERRAKAVYDILINAGISESRITYKGGGIDASVNKDSAAARQMVRRVTFRLINE